MAATATGDLLLAAEQRESHAYIAQAEDVCDFEGDWHVGLYLQPLPMGRPFAMPIAFQFNLRTWPIAQNELFQAGALTHAVAVLEYSVNGPGRDTALPQQLAMLASLQQTSSETWDWKPELPAFSKGLDLRVLPTPTGDKIDLSSLFSGRDPRLPGFDVGGLPSY